MLSFKIFFMKNFFAKFFALFLILQIATPGVIASTVESVWVDELYYENEIIIQYDENQVNIQNEKTLSSIENNIKNNNSEVKEAIPEENIVVVERKNNPLENVLDTINGTSKEKKMEKIINLYKEDPAMIHAQSNFKYKIHSAPKFNNLLYAEQWYLENIGTPITGMGKIYEAHRKPGRESIASINNLNIDYEEAFNIYEIARERLSEEEKNKKNSCYHH